MEKNQNKKSVAVAMSGGVDSSVAAALLKDSGYDVIGLTMQLWDFSGVGGNVYHEGACCSVETMYDARSVCHSLGIPHYVIDVRQEFEKHVIDNFENEYLKGRTPNPCILCNSKMKWEVLLKKAVELDCDFFATGHYARVEFDDAIGRFLLKRGLDSSKDQAYALWGLSQDQLKRTIFPLGDLTKTEVRKIAASFNLKTKDKKESQEICFVPDDNYPRFLKEKHPELITKLDNGEITDQQGNVLGHHQGYPFYTIGQRRGLGVAVGRPVYVTEIDPKTNRITVGEKEDLHDRGLIAKHANWISIEKLIDPLQVEAQIRYNDPGRNATVFHDQNGDVKVIFETYHQAVTPGQSVVFFSNDSVIGGAVIDSAIKSE